jgi:hypothetical protein
VNALLLLERYDEVPGRPKKVQGCERCEREKDDASGAFSLFIVQSDFHGRGTHAFYHFFFILGDKIALKRGKNGDYPRTIFLTFNAPRSAISTH